MRPSRSRRCCAPAAGTVAVVVGYARVAALDDPSVLQPSDRLLVDAAPRPNASAGRRSATRRLFCSRRCQSSRCATSQVALSVQSALLDPGRSVPSAVLPARAPRGPCRTAPRLAAPVRPRRARQLLARLAARPRAGAPPASRAASRSRRCRPCCSPGSSPAARRSGRPSRAASRTRRLTSPRHAARSCA